MTHKRRAYAPKEPVKSDAPTEAWTLDAHFYSDPTKIPLIESSESNEFLSNLNVLGVVAPKGMGKTFLLRRKSLRLREHETGWFFPKTDPCEKFDRIAHDFALESLDRFNTSETWKTVWCTAIASVVIYGTGGRFSEGLARLLGVEVEIDKAVAGRRTLTVESALGSLLRARLRDYQSVYTSELKTTIGQLRERVFVFLDNADEALDKHVGETLRLADGQSGSHRRGALSSNMWTGAQLGLLAAMRDLYLAGRRVRVYASLRKEAIDAGISALSKQESDLYTPLTAERALVERIFLSNIAIMRREDLASPDASDPYERFVGFPRIPHWRVTSRSGEPREEKVFDFLYRHSFGRPRELLELGREISRIPVTQRNFDRVREVTGAIAKSFFHQYKKEMIPYWDDRYEELLAQVNSNVLPERTVLTIFNRLTHEQPSLTHPFSYFISRGLIGKVRLKKITGRKFIAFGPVGSYISAPIVNVGENSHYFMHPCLEESLRERNSLFEVDSRQIVGEGYAVDEQMEADVLHIRWVSQNRFVIEFRGTEMDGFASGRSYLVPLFVALACAASSAQSAMVSREQLLDSLSDLVSAQLTSGHWESKTLVSLVSERIERDPVSGSTYLDDDLRKIGTWLKEACENTPEPLISFASGTFELHFCVPEKIDVVHILNKIYRAKQSLICAQAGQPQIQ